MKTERLALSDELEERRDTLGVVRALTGPYVGMGRRSKWRRRIKELRVTGHFKMHLLGPLQSAPPWERLVFSLMVGLYKGGFARMWWLCWRV